MLVLEVVKHYSKLRDLPCVPIMCFMKAFVQLVTLSQIHLHPYEAPSANEKHVITQACPLLLPPSARWLETLASICLHSSLTAVAAALTTFRHCTGPSYREGCGDLVVYIRPESILILH
jgi:hypothetical protein